MTVMKKFWVGSALAVGIVLVIAAAGMLFVTARLQQDLLTRTPQYNATDLYSRGVAQLEGGDYKAAEDLLEQALQQQDESSYRSQLAVVKYRLKKYPEAIAHYEKLISAGKDASFAWNGIGNAYRDWADQDAVRADELRLKSVDAYRQAILLNGQYVAAYNNLALLYDSQEMNAEAQIILDQGIAATSSSELRETRSRITSN
jgi:tetratricopeptide (TPR) repeat protein